ncbi:MAG: exodeoxyribonuclease VII small subunit [Anaerohalosphaeraceae bacterium]|nr:exodeoxyribonuclease VII small subunit [Anaerohalosphaeraceae bacterium]
MAEKTEKIDISELSFEDSIKKLTEIVGQIEQGQIKLEDSLDKYSEGMEMIKHCREILQKAEKRIEKISAESVSQ